MSSVGATLKAYVELARLSNVPTCVSNVLTGAAIGLAAGGAFDWAQLVLVAVAIMLMYIAGMALNDAVDVDIDRRERPDRPIPSGRVTLRAAYILAGVCLAGGVAILAIQGWYALYFGVGLAATIVVYDLLHKRMPAAVLLMGACRGLVYLAAAAAFAWPLDWTIAGPLAGIITAYVALLTIVARVEAGRTVGSRRWLAYLLPLVALTPIAFVQPASWSWWPIVTGVMLLIWLILAARHVASNPPRIGRAVMAWLAGLCLIDAFCLSLLERPILTIIAIACFGLTILGHRFILGS